MPYLCSLSEYDLQPSKKVIDFFNEFTYNTRAWPMKYRKLKQVTVGAGRIFDFARSYDSALHKKYLNTDARQLDRDAMSADWDKMGKDFKVAMTKERARNK
jgi:hypothetical protein